MDIYIAHQTAGGGGGGPRGNLGYFDKVMAEALSSPFFESSFDEFWLTLHYLPLGVLSDIPGIDVDYKNNYYNKLPTSRLNRRYKKIEVSLQAHEFAEHFGKNGKLNSQHKPDTENISETDLAKMLIDKFIEAGTLVNAKLREGDVFDFESFKAILLSLRQKINSEFLIAENERKANEITSGVLAQAVRLREDRKKSDRSKDKIIRDFRVYYSGLPVKGLYPYDYQYSEIFRNLLKKKGLKCPTYTHLYIQVAKTFEECLMGSFAPEKWQAYGLSVIDYDRYVKSSDIEKEKIVFETLATGLKDIADIDGLDMSIVNSTIEEIGQTGLNTELEGKTVENKHHKLRISYLSGSMEDECPIFFTLTEKSSNNTRKVLIGKADIFQIGFWLQKISLTKTHIKIKSSDTIAAQVWLKDKPRNMEFSINEILNG